MELQILKLSDSSFSQYGQIIEGYDYKPLLWDLVELVNPPLDGTMYVPSFGPFEQLPIYHEFMERAFGGMPIQIGYCIGNNNKLDCLEYHRTSEINVFATDVILFVGLQQDIQHGKYKTENIEAFHIPAMTVLEFYATTLHNTPCNMPNQKCFYIAEVLPKDTNAPIASVKAANCDDKMLFAKNKWLMSLPGASSVHRGVYVGLEGKNIFVSLAGNLYYA